MRKLPVKNSIANKALFKKKSILEKFFNKNNSKNTSENYSEMVDNFFKKIKSKK